MSSAQASNDPGKKIMSSDRGHGPRLSDDYSFVFTVYPRAKDVVSIHKPHIVSKTELKTCLKTRVVDLRERE